MKVLVTGAAGLLGTELVAVGGRRTALDVVGLDRGALDVTDGRAVRRAMEAHRPDVVIHAAAYTAVDRAEAEPEKARAINVGGARNVAFAAAEAGALFVYPSTDFVFDGEGDRPYRPDDATNPLGVYGRTKRDGEVAVAEVAGDGWLVVRTSWVYGAGGRNFVDAILGRARQGQGLRVVDDQTGSPTWARNLAEGLVDLAAADTRGTVHFTDAGGIAWLELAREALRLEDLVDVPVEGVSTAEWGAAAPRPTYSVLDTSSAETILGRPMMPWKVALGRYLRGRGA